jgi:DNA-binding MarR family transcriptional regulator
LGSGYIVKYLHDMTPPTPTPTAVLDRVLRLAQLVQADLARFEREEGLTTPRVHVLWVLGQAGPSTQQALARALEVTPRNITGLVDGLVASGHVTREPHPTDRRATLVTPTERGRETIAGLTSSHDDLARRLFGDVPPARLATFDEVLTATAERFAELMEEVR